MNDERRGQNWSFQLVPVTALKDHTGSVDLPGSLTSSLRLRLPRGEPPALPLTLAYWDLKPGTTQVESDSSFQINPAVVDSWFPPTHTPSPPECCNH